ncbi:MAG: (d)CMP kinase [Thermoleophilia bacterium]|nr:(d)CMP kinase [Thermoleophilia bacterium]
MIVAIDGPAGAGKSTVARALADRLGFRYLDTGAMYRALTWLALRDGVALSDGAALSDLAHAHPVGFGEGSTVTVDDADVTAEIRAHRIDGAVSQVARHPEVREVMRERQREIAHTRDVVIEGRDIGVVVVPDAELKVWLTADPAVRAARRHAERDGTDREALARDLHRRDAQDAGNTHRADDAVDVDTTQLTLDGVIEVVVALVAERRLA